MRSDWLRRWNVLRNILLMAVNIWSLFDEKRFRGCENERQNFSDLAALDECGLSLRCEETPEGGARLLVVEGDTCMPAEEFALPAHLKERIAFWNAWVSYALETYWEQPVNPYGPEAYAASIAMGIAAAYPERRVDWCGLPVHDDYSIWLYLRQMSFVRYREGIWYPSLGNGLISNKYLRELKAHSASMTESLPKKRLHYGFYNGYDACYLSFYVPDSECLWSTMWNHSFYIEAADGYPQWLEDEADRCGELYGCDTSREYFNWECCKESHDLRLAALSIDVMHLTKPSIAVVADSFFHPVYVANPEEFPPSVLQ